MRFVFAALLFLYGFSAFAWWLLYPTGRLWPLYAVYTIVLTIFFLWLGIAELRDWLFLRRLNR